VKFPDLSANMSFTNKNLNLKLHIEENHDVKLQNEQKKIASLHGKYD